MPHKWRIHFLAFFLDVAILTLLTFYKYNFVFPNSSQFVLSGDFLRPVTIESASAYYVYPFILNEHGTIFDPTIIAKIPYWLSVTAISHVTSLNVGYWLLIVITQILGCLLISTSARTLFPLKDKLSYYLVPLIPSIFVCLSYPMNYRPYWLYLPLLPGMLQYILIASGRALNTHELNVQTKLVLTLLGYVAFLQIHVISLLLITLAFVFLSTILLQKNRLMVIRDFSAVTFWLCLPSLLLMIPIVMVALGGVSLSPSYVYSYSVLEMMNSKANLVNAFTFSTGFWEKVAYSSVDKLITLVIVSLSVMLSLFATRKKAFLLSIFLVFVASISFELGINNPIYRAIADPSSPLAWILRDPFKISLVTLGLFSTVLTFSLKHLSVFATAQNKRIVIAIFSVLVLISLAVWSPATKTLQILKPSTIPNEYFAAIAYLNENSDGPLLFLPIDAERYEWADNPYLQGSFLARSFQGAYIDYTGTSSSEVKELLYYASCKENTRVLSLVSTGIVIDTSMYQRGSYFDSMANYIISNCSEDIVELGEHLYFLPNEDYSRFEIVKDPFIIMGSTDYKYLGSLSEFLNGSQSVVFLDAFMQFLGNGKEMRLSPKLTEPSIAWSLAYTHDPLHGAWHYYLEKRGIENWQTDYGRGLAFTWATSRLGENPRPSNNDLIKEWPFDSTGDLDQWKNYTPENQFGTHYTLTLDNGTLKAELWNSTWGWKNLNSPLIPTEFRKWYRWEIQIKGKNADRAHIKIIEYDQEEKIVNARQVEGIGSGDFDWSTVIIDTSPQSPETKYVQLALWHGQETEQPLPNVIWIDNVKVYDLQRYVSGVTLEIPVELEEANDYVFLVRYFGNQDGGEIQIQLDDAPYTVDTNDQLNRFTWERIDNISMQKGQHKITLTNLEGFNAVNFLALVPEQEYQNAQDELENAFGNKRILHILEAEYDLHHDNATTSNRTSRVASNGQVLILNENSTVWHNLTIARTDNYTVAIRSKGLLQIHMDNETYTVDSTTLSWNYLNTTQLSEDEHIIRIVTPNSAELDLILLYSTQNGNETLQDIFTENEEPVNISNYRKLDPTKYFVRVDASKPFILSFAEAYDPLWICRVNGARISSSLLYGATNGFWINQTGHLEITVEYEPQRWFYTGCLISLASFAAFILFVIANYAKHKNVLDKMRRKWKTF